MGGGWVRERACLLLASRPAALMLAPPPPPLTRRPRPLLLKQTGVSAGAQGLQALVALNRGGSSWLAVSVQQLRACWSVRRRPAGRPHKILWHGAWRQQLWSVCQMQRSAALPTRRVYALGAWRPEPARGAWPGRRHASASARRDFCAEVAALRHPRPAIRVPRNRLAEPHYYGARHRRRVVLQFRLLPRSCWLKLQCRTPKRAGRGRSRSLSRPSRRGGTKEASEALAMSEEGRC